MYAHVCLPQFAFCFTSMSPFRLGFQFVLHYTGFGLVFISSLQSRLRTSISPGLWKTEKVEGSDTVPCDQSEQDRKNSDFHSGFFYTVRRIVYVHLKKLKNINTYVHAHLHPSVYASEILLKGSRYMLSCTRGALFEDPGVPSLTVSPCPHT